MLLIVCLSRQFDVCFSTFSLVWMMFGGPSFHKIWGGGGCKFVCQLVAVGKDSAIILTL